MYYDLSKKIMKEFDEGQVFYYSPSTSIDIEIKSSIIIYEVSGGYSARDILSPKETITDPHYVATEVNSDEVEPISVETHPEIFFRYGINI